MQKILEKNIEENINKLKSYLIEIKELEKVILKKKESLRRLEYLYKGNFINREDYERIKEDLLNEINKLETKLYELLGVAYEILDETKKLYIFAKETKKIKKDIITIKPTIVENVIQETEKLIDTYIGFSPTNYEESKYEYKIPGKVIFGNRYKIIKQLFQKEKKEKKKESLEERKLRLLKKKKEINISDILTQYIIIISVRLFGKLSDIILSNFPSLYVRINKILRETGYKMLARTFLSIIFFAMFIFIILSILFIIALKNILLLLLLIGGMLAIWYIPSFYLEHKKKEKEAAIDRNLPFIIVHMASLSNSGLGLKEIIKIIANTEEYGEASIEFRKILDYLDMGLSLSDAIKLVAEETPSQYLREFLEELVLTIQSGQSLRDFLEIAAESAIIHYKSQNEKFVQALKTFSDIYVGMVVTAPIILISVIIVLASLAEKAFGIPIPLLTLIIVYAIVPAINIGMLMFISKLHPK